MAGLEARGEHHLTHRDLVDLPRLHQRLAGVAVAIAQALRRVGEVVGLAVGVDVDELDHHVAVHGR
jgi:hypothetical protein